MIEIFFVFLQIFGALQGENLNLNPLFQPSRSSNNFDHVFFQQRVDAKKSKPLLSLKVRAYNRVYRHEKDELLKEISVETFKKEQNEIFEKVSRIEENEPVLIQYSEPEDAKVISPKIFHLPKSEMKFNGQNTDSVNVPNPENRDRTFKIGGETLVVKANVKSETKVETNTVGGFSRETVVESLAKEHNEEEVEEMIDDDFQLVYNEEKMEYVLMKPPTTSKPVTKSSWNGDESKEVIGDDENTRDKEINKILDYEVHEVQPENLSVDNITDTIPFVERKSLKKTSEIGFFDSIYLEKEEFSVHLPPGNLTIWRQKLSDLKLLEHRSADEHRDYGSSYIVPVLKSVKYDNTSVPLAFNDVPVNVAVAFNFLYLANFDSDLMEYSMDVEMEFSWFDIRLINNYTKPIRIREKSIIDQIWKPDCYIVNSKHSYFHHVTFPNVRMRIMPDGLVTYTMRVSAVCSCFMSFCLYPHDQQTCDLKISSIAYSNQYVRFYWHSEPIRFQSKITLPELHITKIRTDVCETERQMVDSSCLRIIFLLERDSARFVIEKYVPSTLAMMFAWVAPYVPYNYEDVRIITPITVLLTLVQMEKGDKEIRTSYLTSIDVWFAAMKAFTVLSLLESLTVLALIKRSRAMIKNAERAANEFERSYFQSEASRLNRLYHRLDSICRFSSPTVFVIFFVYYVLFIAQGNNNCVDFV